MHPSMISKDGDISINIKCKEVTWFNFLQYSRDTNSVFGGWNSKSYWIKSGLEILSGADFIRVWTNNSLSNDIPEPRKKDFMFNRKFSGRRDAIITKGVENIDHLSENDINAFLFIKNDPFFDYNLIGYEIPLVDDKEGQLKIDLVGLNVRDNKIGIIELKQSNSPSNSPLFALVELLCYGIQLLKCKTNISKEMIQKNDQIIEEHYFNNINLLIAAPEMYWNYWGFVGNKKIEIKDYFNKLLEIINPVIIEKTGSSFYLEFYKINSDFSTEKT